MEFAKIKKELRRQNKLRRASLTAKELSLASQAAAQIGIKHTGLLKARKVLSYIPFAGEIDPKQLEVSLNAEIFLPRITHFRLGKMQFYPATSRRRINHYGINEPCGELAPLNPKQLDAVIVPLVAFNRSGDRLGQGAGFYDRAFAFRRNNNAASKPLLIGLAYDFQEADHLRREPWDVPLDAIITNTELIKIA